MNEKRPGRYRGKGGKTEVQLVVAWALKTFYFTLRYSRLTTLGWLQVQLHIRAHLFFFKFSSPLGEDRVLSRGPCVMQEACVGFSCPGVWPVAGSRVNTTLDNEMTRLIRSLGGLFCSPPHRPSPLSPDWDSGLISPIILNTIRAHVGSN